MARWPSSDQPLAPFFDRSVGENIGGWIPCGICSVNVDEQPWAICPRRLLTFEGKTCSSAQEYLVNKIYLIGGFTSGERVPIWSEMALRDKADQVNYRLDYVLLGDSGIPVVVEVMTASTSGGNKKKGTDIQSAFCNAVLFAEGNRPDPGVCPGVNIRQVWARMASQLVVKSQIVNAWGGKTIWVIQDALADYMREKTGLRLDDLRSSSWETGEINMLTADLLSPRGVHLYAGPVKSKRGEACWADLLDTPYFPDVSVMYRKLDRDTAIAEIVVP